MYYLYVKTHNITGLKYLGQTSKDPFKYKGSGKYWLRHIQCHSNDVTTQILLQTESKKDLATTGEFFSVLYNVTNDNKWANLIPETGGGGHNPASKTLEAKQKRLQTLKRNSKTWTHSKESLENMSAAALSYWSSGRSKHRRQQEFFGPPKPPGWYKNNVVKHQCPHCKKEGDLRNMKRWHFDNCKLNPKVQNSSEQKVYDHS